MSPREKRRIALISVAVLAVAIFCFALYYIPTFLYVLFILGVCTLACFCHAGGPSQHTRLGPHPRPALAIPPALRRWLPGKTANGVPSAGRVSSRGHQGRPGTGELGDSAAPRGERRWEVRGAFQKEAEGGGNGSFASSPRDLLMGSYLSKADSPGAGGASRELRERLARPNHAVHTPNRRLSFGDSLGAAGRFSITPQRHYPLQQPGCPSLGPLPPVQWDGCRRKNVLTPRNSPAARSPVTVKIARPEPSRTRSPLFDRLSSPLTALAPGLGASVDPCSKEAVLTALKEGRKREVEEEEEGRSCSEGQESKRRRHDSSGSAHSAFEPLLANGVPSQLVPKPGTLKRGANALLMDETLMKRSRTSSVSSLSSGLAPSGVLGSARNPILSSYSSSRGYLQQKKTPALSLSPLSSPGSSRSQTPERPTKKLREEEAFSSTFLSAAKSDTTPKDQARETEKPSPAPTVPVAPSSPASRGAEGKRKRRIQLVSSRRGDSITLPPPPELGYSITVSDLDSEKKAALHRIRKVLEEPEPAKSTPAPAVPVFSQAAVSASSPLGTASLLLYTSTTGAPTPPSVSIAAPASNPGMAGVPSSSSSSSGVAPASSTAASPLLESLRKMQNSPALSTVPSTGSPAAGAEMSKGPVVTFSMSSPPVLASLIPGAVPVKTEPGPAPAQPPQPAASASQPSATQVAPPAASSGSQTGALTFGLASTAQPMAALSFATTTTTSAPNAKPLLSAFKPVFGAPAPAVTSSSVATTFKTVFGSSTASSAFGQPVGTTGGAATTSSATAATSAASIFTGLSASTSAPASGTQTPAKPAFGSWGAGASSSTAAQASTAGGTFQFAAAATAAPVVSAAPAFNSSGSAFPFGKPAASTAPAQSAFTFGQGSSSQTPAAGAFGSFGAPPASTAAGTAASQATFAFGKPSFDGPATFGSAAPAAAAKPFTFGGSGAAGATPFSFGGGPTTTAAPSFGTPSQPAFGSGSTGFSFGTTTAAAAAPAFGSTTQTSAPLPVPTPSFSFGAAAGAQASAPPASQGAPQPTAGFSFGGGLSSAQFAAPAAPSPAFSFGASNAKDSKPAFGISFGKASFDFGGGTPTPAFGQSSTGGPLPFGSPGTPAPGFGGLTSTPFGATPGASFSIGSGSKSSARQRLQARRQHPRKK